jgi:hypothetical protein
MKTKSFFHHHILFTAILFLQSKNIIFSSSEFVSSAISQHNCTSAEFSYGTRCICTWVYFCQSSACRWITSPCGTFGRPFCTGVGEDSTCIAGTSLNVQDYDPCVPNQMISTAHCRCGNTVCPKSVYKTQPTLDLVVMNYCSTDLNCIRNDYGSYEVFPFNGLITGADPEI